MKVSQKIALSLVSGIFLSFVSITEPIAVQAAEISSQNPLDGVIKSCKGQSINLGAPKLTDDDLKVLTGCNAEVMPQLIEALKAKDWKVKVIAAHTLGLFGVKARSAIPALSSLVGDENADIRFAAAQALGDIGTEDVVLALTKALQDKDENVRVSAATAFQKIGTVAKSAKPVLIAALWDGNWYVRSRVAATISKLGLDENDIPDILKPLRNALNVDSEIPSELSDDGEKIVSLMLSIYPPVFNKLEDLPLFFIKGLHNENPTVRESAAIVLGNVSSTRIGLVRLHEIMYALQKTVEDRNPNVRISTLKALIHVKEGFRWKQYYTKQRYIREIAIIESVLKSHPLEKVSLDVTSKNLTKMDLSERAISEWRAGKIGSKSAVSIFIEGLKSDNPSIKLNSIFALHQMCGRHGNDPSCADVKLALPMLIDTLKVNIKPLKYAAALAIADIDPKKESGINVLKEVLLEETDYNLQIHAFFALQKIGSLKAFSAMTQSLGFLRVDDKKIRYHRSCSPQFAGSIPFKHPVNRSYVSRLLLKALDNEDIRFSVSQSFLNNSFNTQSRSFLDREGQFPEIQFIVSKLTTIIKNNPDQFADYPVLENIFKHKRQDLRRSAIYALGRIRTRLGGDVNYYYDYPNGKNSNPQMQKKIIDILITIVKNQNEDLDIRWMAAAQLQVANINMDDFFLKEKLINPATALAQSRWIGINEVLKIHGNKLPKSTLNKYYRPVISTTVQLQSKYGYLLNQYGFISGIFGISGLNFDIYSKQYIYDSRTGCGDGLADIFDSLRKLLGGS